jgi:hypothetical protein
MEIMELYTRIKYKHLDKKIEVLKCDKGIYHFELDDANYSYSCINAAINMLNQLVYPNKTRIY